MRASYVYLASPYSSPDPAIRHQRFIAACEAGIRLFDMGISAFIPVVQSHPIAERMGDRHADHAYWMAVDLPLLAKAAKLIVLTLDGWRESRGVADKIEFAKDRGIPVEYMAPI